MRERTVPWGPGYTLHQETKENSDPALSSSSALSAQLLLLLRATWVGGRQISTDRKNGAQLK